MKKFSSLMSELNALMVQSTERMKKAAEEPPTEHPSGQGDNGTQPTTEGSQSKDNEAMVVDQVGPASVDNSDSVKSMTVEETMPNIGVTQSESGGDPSSETASVKMTLKDPGTESPATISGEQKYAQMVEKYAKMSYSQLNHARNQVVDQMNSIIRQYSQQAVKAASQVQATRTPHPDNTAKEAYQAFVLQTAEEYVKYASDIADLTAHWLKQQKAEKKAARNPKHRKRAEEMMEGGDPAMQATPEGDMLPPENADMPPGAMAEEMDATVPSGIEDEELQNLLAALEEKGITPEQFLQMLQNIPPEAFAEAPADMPPGGEMDPAMMQALEQEGKMAKQAAEGFVKVAGEVSRYYRPEKNAKLSIKQARRRAELSNYIDKVIKIQASR